MLLGYCWNVEAKNTFLFLFFQDFDGTLVLKFVFETNQINFLNNRFFISNLINLKCYYVQMKIKLNDNFSLTAVITIPIKTRIYTSIMYYWFCKIYLIVCD